MMTYLSLGRSPGVVHVGEQHMESKGIIAIVGISPNFGRMIAAVRRVDDGISQASTPVEAFVHVGFTMDGPPNPGSKGERFG